MASKLLFKSKERNGRPIQKELAQLKGMLEMDKGKLISVRNNCGTFFLRTFSDDVEIRAAENDHGYSFYASFDGIRLAGMMLESTCSPNLWNFKDSSCAISYITPQGKRRFVSETWEINAAARQLGLELILN
jgi:hypothetical protein